MLAAWVASPSWAIELHDGRVELHGFGEMQLRAIARDFEASDDWDLTQFANVFNLEIEADLAPEGFGPFDLLIAFSRIEVHYDCVWTRACGLFSSADAFGNRARKLPRRLNDGRRAGFVGSVFTGDTRDYRGQTGDELRWIFRNRATGSRRPYGIDATPAFNTLFRAPGQDQVLGTSDDPSPFFFGFYLPGSERCKFSSRKVKGPEDGVGVQNLGPHDPTCEVDAIATFADKPNPFRSGDVNPLTGSAGGLALPYRQAPRRSFRSGAPPWEPRGLWIPNAPLAEMLEEGEVDDPPINFTQSELAWNRGASQGWERELKELYLDMELFDSRLWLRLGRQTIVWGKTELFRNQDQFNPQDLALSSLPGLEESRTALWAARAAWSFYNVGPLEDLRLELAANLDQYEPNDLGTCGEPYAVVLVCAGTFGFLANGFEGLGLVGERRPPDPWESWKGVEAGLRVEFRWERFSFAITDFYGYSDLPYLEKVFTYERNVDPRTGRPRRLNARGPCRTGTEADCLGPGDDALRNQSANQTLFAKNCAATLGFVFLDPAACGLSVFNSPARTVTDPADPGFA
ncbi:MAG: DUF1302 family protein, partial [Myxococcota bacterium]|nr:DUF1302 family protein [Myxococcota bacterium]